MWLMDVVIPLDSAGLVALPTGVKLRCFSRMTFPPTT
jgi:hypothetical protein